MQNTYLIAAALRESRNLIWSGAAGLSGVVVLASCTFVLMSLTQRHWMGALVFGAAGAAALVAATVALSVPWRRSQAKPVAQRSAASIVIVKLGVAFFLVGWGVGLIR